MYSFTNGLKTAGILVATITLMVLSLIVFDKLTVCIENIGLVSEQAVDLPIISEDHTKGFLEGEMTVFVVEYNHIKYTLSSVSTDYVRTYYVGDMIPVKVMKYETGFIRLSVNMTAVSQFDLRGELS